MNNYWENYYTIEYGYPSNKRYIKFTGCWRIIDDKLMLEAKNEISIFGFAFWVSEDDVMVEKVCPVVRCHHETD